MTAFRRGGGAFLVIFSAAGLYWNALPTGWGIFFLVGGIVSLVLQWAVDSMFTATQRERVNSPISWDWVVFESALLILIALVLAALNASLVVAGLVIAPVAILLSVIQFRMARAQVKRRRHQIT